MPAGAGGRTGGIGRLIAAPTGMRIWCNGSIAASQAAGAGSIPVIRSTAGWAWPAALSKRPGRVRVMGCALKGVDWRGKHLSVTAYAVTPPLKGRQNARVV